MEQGRRWGVGSGWAIVLAAIACSPGPSDREEADDDDPPCELDTDCGPLGMCLDSMCQRCGDGTFTLGQPCFGRRVVVDDTASASRMFLVRQAAATALLSFTWSDPRIRLLRRNGAGGLDVHWMLAGSEVTMAAVADLDADGWDDAVLGMLNGPGMSPLWLGATDVTSPGSWGFVRPTIEAALPPDHDLPACVIAQGSDDLEWWYAFEAGLVWGGALDVPYGSQVVAADLDGDATLDLAVATLDGRVLWYRRHDAGLVLEDELDGFVQTYPSALQIRAGDVDADGRDDVLMLTSNEPQLAVIRSERDEGLVLDAMLETECGRDAAVADVDGDDRPELLVTSCTADLHAFSRSADGVWSAPRIIPVPGTTTRSLAPLDVDEDGVLDLVVSTSEEVVVLYGDP